MFRPDQLAMPSDRQLDRIVQRLIEQQQQQQRKKEGPYSWQGFNRNNLGEAVDPSGNQVTGLVSGDASTSEGDPVLYLGEQGQPGMIVRQGSKQVPEWQAGGQEERPRYVAVAWDYDTEDALVLVGDGTFKRFPLDVSAYAARPNDFFYTYSDSNGKIYALGDFFNYDENFYVRLKQVTGASVSSAPIWSRAKRSFSFNGTCVQHDRWFTLALDGGTADIELPLLGWALYDIAADQWQHGEFSVSFQRFIQGTQDGWFRFNGPYTFFDGVTQNISVDHSRSFSFTQEPFDGPWPTFGGEYEYVYFAHGSSSNVGGTTIPGLPYSALDPCDPDYFIPFRGYNWAIGGSPWSGGVPAPVASVGLGSPYISVNNVLATSTVRFLYELDGTPRSGWTHSISGSIELRDGNLGSFTVVESYAGSGFYQRVIARAIYPAVPDLNVVLRFGPSTGPFFNATYNLGTVTWGLVYSDLDACKDPRPYTRSRIDDSETFTANLWQPLAESPNYRIYLEATGINYASSLVDADALVVGPLELAPEINQRDITWSASVTEIWREDKRNGQRQRMNSRPNVSLHVPGGVAFTSIAVGSSYTVNYSNVYGSVYRAFVYGLNAGSQTVDFMAPLNQRNQYELDPATKAYWQDLVAGEIPVFGLFVNQTYEGISDRDVIWKGRITSIAVNLNVTQSQYGVPAMYAPIEILSFTYVVDEVQAVSGQGGYLACYFYGLYDLYRISGPFQGFSNRLFFNTGELAAATYWADATTPQRLIDPRVNLAASLLRPATGVDYLFDVKGYDLLTWKVEWFGDEQFLAHSIDFPYDEVLYAEDINSPQPKYPGVGGVFGLFKLFKLQWNADQGWWDCIFDRIVAVGTDIKDDQRFTGPIFGLLGSTDIIRYDPDRDSPV